MRSLMKLREVSMERKQERLLARTPEEIEKLKLALANLTEDYIQVESEKKLKMKDFNDRLAATWEQMEKLEAAINEI